MRLPPNLRIAPASIITVTPRGTSRVAPSGSVPTEPPPSPISNGISSDKLLVRVSPTNRMMSPGLATWVASTIRLNGFASEPLRVVPPKALSTINVRTAGLPATVNGVAARNQKSKLPPANPSPSPSRALPTTVEPLLSSASWLAAVLLKSTRS